MLLKIVFGNYQRLTRKVIEIFRVNWLQTVFANYLDNICVCLQKRQVPKCSERINIASFLRATLDDVKRLVGDSFHCR